MTTRMSEIYGIISRQSYDGIRGVCPAHLFPANGYYGASIRALIRKGLVSRMEVPGIGSFLTAHSL